MLAKDMPPYALCVNLVEPRAAQRVEFDVVAHLSDHSGNAPKLFLESSADAIGRLYSMAGQLREGAQTVTFQVPLGEYELDVVPLGSLRIPGEHRVLRVSESPVTRRSIGLAPPENDTTLVLEGLERNDFPVTVYPRPTDRIQVGRHDLLFSGRYRWRSAEQRISPLEGKRRVVVTGRNRYWISQSLHGIRGDRVEVPLRRASLVVVHWHAGEDAPTLGATVEVTIGATTEIFPLVPQLVAEGGTQLRALAGGLILARGAASLRCVLGDGRVAWTRRLTVGRDYHCFEVDTN